jgi:glycerophosphoryl diester phosphodiesterase
VVAHDPTYPDGTALTDLSGTQTDQRGTLRLRTLLDELPPVVG